MSIITSDTSITHTFGNVACEAMEFIKSYFSDDFFRTEHISTKISYRQLDMFRTHKEFWKHKKPIIILKPRIDIDDSTVAGYGAATHSRITNSKSPVEFGETHPVIVDRTHGVMLRFAWNRIKLYYDIAIIVQTYNEQVNLAQTLKNRLVPPTPYYLKTTLEACIPKGIIQPISHHLGFQDNNPERTAGTIHYLNRYGTVPFTYKLKNASGTNEYFMLYDTNIEIIPSDINIDDGEAVNMVNDTFTIGLTMSFEFNTVGTWYVFLQDRIDFYIRNPSDSEIEIGNRYSSSYNADGTIVPLSSIPLKYDLQLGNDWKVLEAPAYFVTSDGIGPEYRDTTSLSQAIPKATQQTILDVYRYVKASGIPLHPFIQFRCFKGTREIPYGCNGFTVDLDQFDLYTYDCTPRVSYRLFILINNLAIYSISDEVSRHSGDLKKELSAKKD